MSKTIETKADQEQSPLGILAGGGNFPIEVANSTANSGRKVHIVALDGEADRDFSPYPTTLVNWGQIGKMIKTFRENGVEQMVFVGRVARPELARLKPDLGFVMSLPAILKIVASGGDDSVLRRVIRFFEKQQIEVIGPADAAPELLIGEGAMGDVDPTESNIRDLELGFNIIRVLGPYDVGQAVVVSNMRIEAIEGVEGTDRVLERVKLARQNENKTSSNHGMLIKRSKPSQELRIDMPAIGPDTITRAEAAKLAGVAVEAGRVLVADRTETTERANSSGLFVVGRTDSSTNVDHQAEPIRRFKATGDEDHFRRLGAKMASKPHRKDAEKGAAVSAVLAPYNVGNTVVVIRNHVIAVSADELPELTVERAAALRQWSSLSRRRRGIVVLRRLEDLTTELIEALEHAHFAGLVLFTTDYENAEFRKALTHADRCGLFVLTPRSQVSEKHNPIDLESTQ